MAYSQRFIMQIFVVNVKLYTLQSFLLLLKIYKWFRTCGCSDIGFNIFTQAEIFRKQLKLTYDVRFSNWWLYYLNKRHRIRKLVLSVEWFSEDADEYFLFSPSFLKLRLNLTCTVIKSTMPMKLNFATDGSERNISWK